MESGVICGTPHLECCYPLLQVRGKGPTLASRAGLKPMQPMRLHWAPRLWGPRASGGPAPCVWIVVHFCQMLFALEFSRNGLYNHIVGKQCSRYNEH